MERYNERECEGGDYSINKPVRANLPTCFNPCPPFNDFCNSMDAFNNKCLECVDKNNLVDFIE